MVVVLPRVVGAELKLSEVGVALLVGLVVAELAPIVKGGDWARTMLTLSTGTSTMVYC